MCAFDYYFRLSRLDTNAAAQTQTQQPSQKNESVSANRIGVPSICSFGIVYIRAHIGLNNRSRPFNMSSLTFWLLFFHFLPNYSDYSENRYCAHLSQQHQLLLPCSTTCNDHQHIV